MVTDDAISNDLSKHIAIFDKMITHEFEVLDSMKIKSNTVLDLAFPDEDVDV